MRVNHRARTDQRNLVNRTMAAKSGIHLKDDRDLEVKRMPLDEVRRAYR